MHSSVVSTDYRIKELNKLLEEAAAAYYQKADPLMTDIEFDLYEKELKQLVKDNPQFASLAPYLTKVGSDLTKNTGRVTHKVPMLSIENMYTEADFLAQYDKWGGVQVVLEPKQDGISASLVYENGKLIQALTRGDGSSGEDMTAQVNVVKSIPKFVPCFISHPRVEIRGELVMRKQTLVRINLELEAKGMKVYASTRNLTAGTMKQKDLSVIPNREIELRPWDVLGDNLPDSRLERLRLLGNNGFSKPESVLLTDRSQVIPVLQKFLILLKTSDV